VNWRHRVILSLATLCAGPVAWADGMLDPDFGTGGLVLTNFGPGSIDIAGALVVQPDGRAIAAGGVQLNLAQSFMGAARYLPSGALDPSFDGDGMVTVEFIPESVLGVGRLLLQPDGRIILVGSATQSPTVLNYALARLNADGSLDGSFGTGGKVLTPLTSGIAAGADGVLQPDGRIVVLGTTGSLSVPVLALARYNPDGTLDGTFGVAGQVSLPLPVPFRGGALALQSDGKVLVAGFTGGSVAPADIGLVRLLPGGAPDPTFDGDGFVQSDFGALEFASSVAVLGDGRIVVAGHRGTPPPMPTADLALVRYLPNGAIDTTFGTAGLATADAGGAEFGQELLVQPDGKLLLAGTLFGTPTSDDDFLLARFQADGAPDTTFGTAGFLSTDFGGMTSDLLFAAALAGPDRILAAGRAMTLSGGDDFGLARYIASTPVEAMSFSVE
jgi:uncharacterized delta-60 repeat protein